MNVCDDFAYQQEIGANVTPANSEPSPVSVSKTFKQISLKF